MHFDTSPPCATESNDRTVMYTYGKEDQQASYIIDHPHHAREYMITERTTRKCVV